MNSDKIQLPGFLIADLYKHSLVEVLDDKETGKKVPQKPVAKAVQKVPELSDTGIKFLGQNGKHVVVIVNNAEVPFVNDDDLQFLTNILNACNFNLGDIAIINTYVQPVNFNELKETLLARHLLLFGVEPGDIKLPFVIPQFQVQQYAGSTIITAPKLADLNIKNKEGKILKTKLWLSLQRCFDLPAR